MSSLKESIAKSEAALRQDALDRLRAAMDVLERELVLVEYGPLTVCDDVEVREQLAGAQWGRRK